MPLSFLYLLIFKKMYELKKYIDVNKEYDTVSDRLINDCGISESVLNFAFGELGPNENTLGLIIERYDLEENDLREKLGEEEESRRTCDECGKEHLKEGYCIDGGLEYYCSDKCLHEHYTEEEREELYNEGEGDSYRTEWED